MAAEFLWSALIPWSWFWMVRSSLVERSNIRPGAESVPVMSTPTRKLTSCELPPFCETLTFISSVALMFNVGFIMGPFQST